MSHVKSTPTIDRATWHVGQRVSRKSSAERGTITEQDGEIKVKWDDGRTSYFRHGREADVQLAQIDE